MLATSREGLGSDGKRLFALRSLGVPSADESLAVETLREIEAVRLFVDRAQLVVHDFALDEANGAAVAAICRRLDGIPLAIKLAAGRVRVLSPEEIRAKLNDRFRLLTGGSKTALPRHQTLRTTMQWSYDLLTFAEQGLLRALSVFAGGWTMAHAARVWLPTGHELETVGVTGRLVEKSLVIVDRGRGDDTRYGLLETVRQYAQAIGDRLEMAFEVQGVAMSLAGLGAPTNQLGWRLLRGRSGNGLASICTCGSGMLCSIAMSARRAVPSAKWPPCDVKRTVGGYRSKRRWSLRSRR